MMCISSRRPNDDCHHGLPGLVRPTGGQMATFLTRALDLC